MNSPTTTEQQSLPSHAQVVIIGGGIMGCGLAFHLAREGCRDVVLLEKAELSSGSTWHAAGQITYSVSNDTLAQCVAYIINFREELAQLADQPLSWHTSGSFRIAYTDDEVDWLRYTVSVARKLKFQMDIVGPDEIRQLHPFYETDGIQAALYTPDDGHLDPASLTAAFARAAQREGVRVLRNCRATNAVAEPNGQWRITTELGEIVCEHVVNAAGTYARQVGAWFDYDLPATSMTHHYLVTDRIPEFENLERELPIMRDGHEVSGYIRMEQKSGLIGIYEKANPNAVWLDGVPWEAEHPLFEADYDRIMPWLEKAFARMPVLAEAGIRRVVHGAISHPPDGNPLLGPVPGQPNHWLCCGCQLGIAWGPGLTRELARWMVHGAADLAMQAYDPRRYSRFAGREYQVTKAKEDYCLRHEVPYPHFDRPAGRPVRTGPLYDRLREQGAFHESLSEWERPRWFATPTVPAEDIPAFRRTAIHDVVGAEVRAVRSGVGVMDLSAFTKIEVAGPNAAAHLDYAIPDRLPAKPGSFGLAHVLNRRGRIELEASVTRLTEDRFYLVCAAFYEQRLLDCLAAASPNRPGANVVNRSDEWAVIALNGPKSRAVLSACTAAELANEAFRWLTVQEIEIAGHRVWALRVSYAGELGWELHGPNAAIAAAYDALMAAGAEHGIVNYGSFAMNSMRMEKAFQGASELNNEVTPAEAGVLRYLQLDKPDFVGKAAVVQAQESAPRWQCTYMEVAADGIADGAGGETVLSGEQEVGTVSSIAFGHSVDKLLAFAYLQPEFTAPNTTLDVLIQNERRRAVILDAPAYDPTSQRPRSEE